MGDLLQDDVTGSASVDLQVGGTTGTAQFWVNPTGSCDITATTGNLVVNVVVSNAAVASVSPAQLTFTACNQNRAVTITPLAVGSADVTLTPNTEPTGSQFNYNSARVPVNVTAATFTGTVTTLSCPASTTYTGSALTPCTASTTGAGGFTATPTVSYTGNTAAGTATVTASYPGDATHQASSASSSFEIAKAPSATTVTCPATVTWTGTAQTPCTARATGAGGLDVEVTPVTHTDNTAVGTATASASYGGDANHVGSSDSTDFEITKAGSTVTVTCAPGPFTYTGLAQEPCSATVTGAGGLDEAVPVTYEGNTNAGTATATAEFTGDATHGSDSDSETFTIGKADATCVVTDHSGTYDGAAHGLAGTCTGVGTDGLLDGLDLGGTFTDAGAYSVGWTFTGGANYEDAAGTGTVTIGRATSTVVVDCPETVTYDGSEQTPCTAEVTGVGGLEETLAISYTANTDAGTATASATYAGDDNHTGSSGSDTFEIAKAVTTTVVTCPDGPHVYTGSPVTPACTATTTGAGGLVAHPGVTFEDNTNAGSATAAAEYLESANHLGSSGSTTFTIDKAPSTVTLICTSPVTYTGSPIEVCSATASGAGIAVPVQLEVVYTDNTDAGEAGASADYDGDANHLGSSDATTFTILPAPTTTVVTCPASVTFDGSAQEPCSAVVTGAGGLDETLTVGYEDNVHAGTATASASYAGDDNHLGSDGSATFTIEQAPTTTTVTCPAGPYVYTGSPVTPDCTATTTGAGGLSVSPAVTFAGNTNAGTATASASYAGDADHLASTGSTTFTIDKAPTTVTVTCTGGPWVYSGTAYTPCTATVTGAGGLDQGLTVTYTNNTGPGTATATATYTETANHLGSTGSATFEVAAWTLKGFYAPVDMNGVWNTVKGGSTVPLKFEVFAGTTELTATTAVASFTATKVSCTSGSEDVVETFTTTGGTSLRYDSTGGQFIQNWQTPKAAGTCYRVTMTTLDGSPLTAYFKLK